MKTIGQMQAFLGNGDPYINADRNPELRLVRVLRGFEKRLDPQILLDPVTKHLPGQKSVQLRRIVPAGIENRQHAGLIAHDVRAGTAHGVGLAALELGVGLGEGDKKNIALMNHIQLLTAIEQVISAGLVVQLVQDVDLVHPAGCDVNERGNEAAQVQHGVAFDRRLMRPKRRPWVDFCVQLNRQRVLRIQRPRHCNKMSLQVGVDLPRPNGVRICQCIAGNSLASKVHEIKPVGLCMKVDLDIEKGAALSQLRKIHRQELAYAGEGLDLVVASVRGNATA